MSLLWWLSVDVMFDILCIKQCRRPIKIHMLANLHHGQETAGRKFSVCVLFGCNLLTFCGEMLSLDCKEDYQVPIAGLGELWGHVWMKYCFSGTSVLENRTGKYCVTTSPPPPHFHVREWDKRLFWDELIFIWNVDVDRRRRTKTVIKSDSFQQLVSSAGSHSKTNIQLHLILME